MKRILVISIISLLTINSFSQDLFISNPTPILEIEEPGIGNPRMIIKSNGQPFFMYSKNGSFIKIVTSNENGTFSSPIIFDVPAMAGITYGPDIKNFNDTIYISYSTNSGQVYFIKSTDDGTSWSTPTITYDFGDAFMEYAKLGINSEGNPRIVSIGSEGSFSGYEQVVTYSNDGGVSWDYN